MTVQGQPGLRVGEWRNNLPETTPVAETVSELVESLQQLRLESGNTSFFDIAARISKNRELAGLSADAARVAKSSVYDAFRTNRKRLNPELIGDIVRALDGSEDEIANWRLRAAKAGTGESLKPLTQTMTPNTDTEHKNQAILIIVVLGAAMVGLNHALNFSATAFQLPLYLDMVGTAFAAFAFGPWVGALIGLTTNFVGNLMVGDFTGSWFSIVQVTGAVIWGYGFKKWFGKKPWRFFSLNLLVGLACSLVAVPIIQFVFGSVSTHQGVATLGDWLFGLNATFMSSQFLLNLLTSLGDKVFSGYVAVLVLWMLVEHGFPVSHDVRVRPRMALRGQRAEPLS